MTRNRLSLTAVVGLVVLAAGALAGCATNSPQPPAATPVAPMPEVQPVDDVDIAAAWLGEGLIGVVTYGSSTCLPTFDEATLDGDVLTVRLDDDTDRPCTMDYVPRVTLVPVEDADSAQDLTVVIGGPLYTGEVELPGVADLPDDTAGTALAGWTQTPGMFVFVTMGSSSCVPMISDVAATGAAEVTVTFAEPEANAVCTMDLAPRAQVVVVEGLEQTSGVELVLTGTAEFDDVRLPIVGSNAVAR